MFRSLLYLILSFIVLIAIMGCSSTNENPISPITPDQPVWVPDRASDTASSDPIVTDDFWNSSIQMNGEKWIANLNPNGTINAATGRGVKENTNPFELINKHPEIFRFSSENFRTEFDEVHASIRYVIMYQTYNNLRVYPTKVDMRYRGDLLVAVGADIYPDINLNTTSSYPLESAKQAVEFEVGSDEPFEDSELVVYVSGDTAYYLAWQLNYGNWVYWVDAHNGSILEREHHYWEEYSGHIHTIASQPDPLANEVPYTMNHLEMRMSWDPNDTYPYYAMPVTNSEGDYSYTDPSYTQLYSEARFYGPYGNANNMNNFPNNEGKINKVTYNGTPADWYFDNGSSIRSERTGWVWTNSTHDFLKSIEPSYGLLDWRVQINVNGDPWCNAYADEGSINFFRPASGCIDTGHVPDIVAHEYAHVNTFEQFGNNQPPSMMSEGHSDILANLMTENHYIGYNVAGQGTYFRDSKNNMKWPAPECGGQGHCLGQVIAGAFWDMYEVLGKEYVGHLYHFSRYARPQTFAENAMEVLLVDDNDGDWTNGTPNSLVIYECFKTNHNIDVPYVEPQTGITLEIIPVLPDIHISQFGGMFDYELSIVNNENTPLSFHIWAAVKLPGGGTYRPFIPPGYGYHAPYYLTWNPHQEFQISLYQQVPPGLPPGAYEYHIRAGVYGGALQDDVWVNVTIDP
ncbi:MAG: hypothetical protein ABIG42_00875 [bacterium]